VAASAGQVFAASSLFTVTDADNDALTYFHYDGTAGGGHFVVNGTAVADQTVVALSAAQLAQTTFVAGASGSSDALSVMAYDGQAYSGNTHFSQFQVSVAGVNSAPVVTIPQANVSASAGQVISASSLFSVTDADNDALTYFLYDGTAGGGHFVVNGTAVADQTDVERRGLKLGQSTFVYAVSGRSEELSVMAYDGQAYSGNTHFSQFQVSVAWVNSAFVVTIPPATVSATLSLHDALPILFSVTDADNDALTYFLYDGTAGGGHFVVNGTAVADQ